MGAGVRQAYGCGGQSLQKMLLYLLGLLESPCRCRLFPLSLQLYVSLFDAEGSLWYQRDLLSLPQKPL